MKKSGFVLSMIFLLAVAFHAELTGDLNGDGRLDIADLVRVNAMASKALVEENIADLDRDGSITATDADILLGLIRGTYSMPRALEFAKGMEYEKVNEWATLTLRAYSGEGFKVTFPSYYLDKTETTSFWTVDSLPESPLSEDFSCSFSPTVGISNLPYANDMTIVLDVPENMTGTPALLLGTLQNCKGDKERGWIYRIIEVDGNELAYKNGQLIWKQMPCIYGNSVKVSNPMSLTVISPSESTREAVRGSAAGDDLGIEFTAYPSQYGPGIYTTTHFLIQPYGFFTLSNIQRLATNLEKAYRIIGGLGFKQNFPLAWGRRIRVNIVKTAHGEEPEDSYCAEPGLLSGPLLEFHDGVMVSDHIGSIVIHELMHYHHYNYNPSNYTCLWLEEMCTTWSEQLMVSDPDAYIPLTYDDPHEVLDGVPRASVKPSLFSDGSVNKAAGSHGYNLYPFAVWLTKKYSAEELWYRIFSSRGYENGEALTALRQGLRGVDSNADIGELYGEFVREFFSEKRTIPYPSPSLTPFACFNGADAARFAANGKKTMIKTPGDLFMKENVEHIFKMPQLGTATWLFTFEQGTDEFMADYKEAVVKANGTQYDFFVLRFDNGKFSMTAPEDIVKDEEKNVSYIRVPMTNIGAPQKRTAFGIVAINHNYDDYNDSASNAITLSVNFSGPLIVSGIVSKTPYDEMINGVYRWIHDYTIVQSDLVFTPLGKTTFCDSEVTVFGNTYNGVQLQFPLVITKPAEATIPDTLEFNITGTMVDVPVPAFVYNANALFFGSQYSDHIKRAECTGLYVVNVEKNVNGRSYSVYFTTEGIGEYNAVCGGMTYTAEDFMPTGAKGLSRFNITIPEIDPKASSYTVSIETHYLMYRREMDSDNESNEGSINNQTLNFEILLK